MCSIMRISTEISRDFNYVHKVIGQFYNSLTVPYLFSKLFVQYDTYVT